ncbi:MAG: DUF4291 domain-containing protein [Bacteroidota bacterium]
MKIETIPYSEYLASIPTSGHHILGQQRADEILVYQAFNPSIAEYAVQNQRFGGSHYSFSRMTWIKPNFLWMMYRCGWAEKVNQESVLGIWLTKEGFTKILEEAVYSSYQPSIYPSKENWQTDLNTKNARLQWDPDHDIYGAKQQRRAIQLGLKSTLVNEFNERMIKEIIDITAFVKQQRVILDQGNIATLQVPEETVFKTDNEALNKWLKIGKE